MNGDVEKDTESPSDAWRQVWERLQLAASRSVSAIEAKWDEMPKPLIFVLGILATLFFENLFLSLYQTIREFASGLNPTVEAITLGPPPEFPVAEDWLIWFLVIMVALNSMGGMTTSGLRNRIRDLEERISHLEED